MSSDPAPDRQPKIAPTAAPSKAPWRVPGPPDHWQHFGLCILFHLLVPLLPIAAEAGASGGRTSASTLHLAASAYALSIGISSRNMLGWGFFTVVGTIFACGFGLSKAASAAPVLTESRWPALGIFVVFVIHLAERYNRHIADREEFLEFLGRKGRRP